MVSVAVCRLDQLSLFLAGITGVGFGHLGANYWLYNMSGTPCRLGSQVTVDLLDGKGHILLARASVANDSDVVLPPLPSRPPNPPNPPGSAAGFAVRFTSTDQARGGAPCSHPLIVPTALRVIFANGVGQTVIRDVDADQRRIEVCDGDVSVDSLIPV